MCLCWALCRSTTKAPKTYRNFPLTHTYTPGAVDTHTHTHTYTPGAVDTHTRIHTQGRKKTHTALQRQNIEWWVRFGLVLRRVKVTAGRHYWQNYNESRAENGSWGALWDLKDNMSRLVQERDRFSIWGIFGHTNVHLKTDGSEILKRQFTQKMCLQWMGAVRMRADKTSQ